MRDRTTFGQVIGLLLMLLAVIGIAGLFAAALPTAGTSTLAPGEPGIAGLAGTDTDCANPITPDRIGHKEFKRYRIAETLQHIEFVAQESLGYIVCSHGQPRHDEQLFQLSADTYFMFARENGELAVTRLEWESDRQMPTSTPRPMSTEDPSALTVCIDIETPIIETGGENPKQWDIPGIMWSLPCGREMGSSICWDCDEDLV